MSAFGHVAGGKTVVKSPENAVSWESAAKFQHGCDGERWGGSHHAWRLGGGDILLISQTPRAGPWESQQEVTENLVDTAGSLAPGGGLVHVGPVEVLRGPVVGGYRPFLVLVFAMPGVLSVRDDG